MFTAGSTWVVDLAPPHRRARVIGLYGLAVWSGLSLGPPIGDALLRASSFEAVWAFATLAPLAGAADRVEDPGPVSPRGDRGAAPVDRARVAAARPCSIPGHGGVCGDGLVHRPAPGRQRHRPRRRRVHGVRGHRRGHAAGRRRPAGPDRAPPLRRGRGGDRDPRAGVDRTGERPSAGPGRSRRDGGSIRAPLPVAVASGGEQRLRDAPGLCPGDVHRVLRPGHGPRRPAGWARRLARRLPGRVLARPPPAPWAPWRWPLRSEEAGLRLRRWADRGVSGLVGASRASRTPRGAPRPPGGADPASTARQASPADRARRFACRPRFRNSSS